MGETTGIQWTDRTYNPWMGCTKVSPGCAHCYMFEEQTRYGTDPSVVRRSKTTFTAPLRWTEPAKVFTCSWSDWFHPAADAWRDEAWGIIRRTPHLTYQILTKRPELIPDRLPADWGAGYPNVWLGVSVENQRFAERARLLLELPAIVRFVSAEPLLGPLRLDLWGYGMEPCVGGIDWIIIGGESGHRARRCDPQWIRALVNQARWSGARPFVKQMGKVLGRELGCRDTHGADMNAWPEDLRIREMPL
jgi:protein gp37